jgi:hypothetical protein
MLKTGSVSVRDSRGYAEQYNDICGNRLFIQKGRTRPEI